MFKSCKWLIVLVSVAASAGAFAESAHSGIGRNATPKEVAAWDIDVRPDFKGLPKGSGTVKMGQQVWDGKCASCHGSFGESNQVFTPIVGGTDQNDIKTGRVAGLSNGTQPQRTTLMKVATVSTLWDYINRAMPWTAPKSLSTTEVYSVLAYILNMGEIVPDDFTLSDKNIAQVQARMPNRNGMTQSHGLWDVKGKPDVKNVACMKNCPTQAKITSFLPEYAQGMAGNPADQNRPFGEAVGWNTGGSQKPHAMPAIAAADAAKVKAGTPAAGAKPASTGALDLAKKYGCVACHGVNNKIVGPAFNDIAAKYKGDAGAEARLIGVVKKGGSGNWGPIPMPAQSSVKDDDVKTLVQWILKGSK